MKTAGTPWLTVGLGFALTLTLGCESREATKTQGSPNTSENPPAKPSQDLKTPPPRDAKSPQYIAAMKACESSPFCLEKGECGGSEHQRCYVRGSADCRQSQACIVWGRCHFDARFGSACVAAHAQDCLTSQACKEDGRCSLGRGSCVIDEAACSRSPLCEEQGRCLFDRQVSKVENIRRSAMSCVQGSVNCSTACTMRGACELDAERKICVAKSDAECRASELCRREGHCAYEASSQSCVVADVRDCAESELCTREGRCEHMAHAQLCMPTRSACEASCDTEGRCERVEGRCQATASEHCANSRACEVQGRCRFDQRGRTQAGVCAALDSTSCEESLECKAYGRCELQAGACVNPKEKSTPTYSQVSCLRDSKCQRHGRCLRDASSKCQTPEEAGAHKQKTHP